MTPLAPAPAGATAHVLSAANGAARLLLAAWFDGVRLIDNVAVEPALKVSEAALSG